MKLVAGSLVFLEEKGWQRCALVGEVRSRCPQGLAVPCLAVPIGSNQPLLSLTLSLYLFSRVIFYKWNSSCFKDKTLMLSPVLAALLEAPTGLSGFGAGEVDGCPFCADFYSCLLFSMGCSVSVHSQQTEP